MGHLKAMELVQIRLLVHDFSACFRFYRDVLGLQPQTNDERGAYEKFSFPDGRAAIALQSRAHFAASFSGLRTSSSSHDAALIALKVEDVDAYCDALSSRGALILEAPTTQWGRLRVAYLRDPEQNLIELQQWLIPASDTPK